MANSDRPRGAIPVGTISGSPINGNIRKYSVVVGASDIFRGDFVKLESDGKVDVASAGTGNPILGVMVGVVVDRSKANSEHPGYSDQAGEILVCVGNDVLYEVQEDNAVSDLALSNIGNNVALVATAGSTTTGMSKQELDSDSATAATEQLRIVDLIQREDNAIGSFAKWLVRINESHFNTAAGV